MSKATAGDTVRVQYTGTLEGGEVFDSSSGRGPLEFTLGESQVIPGFEATVEGMEIGEIRTTTVPADQAYGQVRDELRFPVPKERFPGDVEPQLGQQLELKQPDGRSVPVRVAAVSPEAVTLDANHPLAGEDLTFEIRLEEIVGE